MADEGADSAATDETAARLDRRLGRGLVAGLAVVAALVGLNGWLGYRDFHARAAEQLREQMVAAARQGAINLTTIDHERAEQDVQAILDSSTGEFRDDFARRAKPFTEAAKQAQSKSVGTVNEAALESVSGDQGRVLVAMTVMTSNRGLPEQNPQAWRMRVTVSKAEDGLKVSAVEFIR